MHIQVRNVAIPHRFLGLNLKIHENVKLLDFFYVSIRILTLGLFSADMGGCQFLKESDYSREKIPDLREIGITLKKLVLLGIGNNSGFK